MAARRRGKGSKYMDVITISEAEAIVFSGGDSGSGGDRLAEIITDVSARMASFTGRTDWGAASSRTEYHNGGVTFVAPRYRPIVSVTTLKEDTDHVWGSDTTREATEYYVDTESPTGMIWMESGCLVAGQKVIELVYTGGYSATSAIPRQVKAMAKIQVLHEWNKTERPGRRNEEDTGSRFQLLPEVEMGIADYMLQLPFA